MWTTSQNRTWRRGCYNRKGNIQGFTVGYRRTCTHACMYCVYTRGALLHWKQDGALSEGQAAMFTAARAATCGRDEEAEGDNRLMDCWLVFFCLLWMTPMLLDELVINFIQKRFCFSYEKVLSSLYKWITEHFNSEQHKIINVQWAKKKHFFYFLH